jgi:hypothetical protein
MRDNRENHCGKRSLAEQAMPRNPRQVHKASAQQESAQDETLLKRDLTV